jgi:hypothetical protein
MAVVTLIERLIDKDVDLDVCAVPTTVRVDDGRSRPVVAAAYLPPRGSSERPVHLVVYNQGPDELIAPDDKDWVVSIHYNREDDLGISYTAHGDYDMTFAEAMTRFVRRVERQG